MALAVLSGEGQLARLCGNQAGRPHSKSGDDPAGLQVEMVSWVLPFKETRTPKQLQLTAPGFNPMNP